MQQKDQAMIMILIADSGSTKTDWALAGVPKAQKRDGGFCIRVRTQGLNPFHQSQEIILSVLENELKPALLRAAGDDVLLPSGIDLLAAIDRVAFYGAGCTEKLSSVVERALSVAFPAAGIEVASDLLGAARAVCGKNAGIACILGTGANSCLYDGEKVVDNVPPLGYILGDEGSGAVLGKLFLNAIFKGDLPTELRDLYLETTGLSYPEIIDRVYRQPLANRFLASISKFIGDNVQRTDLQCLIMLNFRSFFKKNILKYAAVPEHRISAVGGVAFTFREQFKQCAREFGFQVGKVIAAPIDGLVEYHG